MKIASLSVWIGLVCTMHPVVAQTRIVLGKVIDQDTKQPIPMVNVQLRGFDRGATTDSAGSFRLALPSGGKFVVSFSHIAYWKISYELELQQGEQEDLKVELEPRTIGLGQVTVTGWHRPEDIFAKVITEKDIEQSAARSLSEIIRLRAPLAMNASYWGFLIRGQGNITLFWNGIPIDAYDVEFIDRYSVDKILIWRAMEAPMSYLGGVGRATPYGGNIGDAYSLLYSRSTGWDGWSRFGIRPSSGLGGYVIDIRTK